MIEQQRGERRIVPVKDLRLQADFMTLEKGKGEVPLMTWVYKVEGVEGDKVKVVEEGKDARTNTLAIDEFEKGRIGHIVLTPLPPEEEEVRGARRFA